MCVQICVFQSPSLAELCLTVENKKHVFFVICRVNLLHLQLAFKSLAEMREERQVHPNMESVFWRTYSSPSALPSAANSAVKDADMHEEEICECVD